MILTRFVDYYSKSCGPKAISVVVEPQGMLTCWSKRLAVWSILACFLDYYSLFWRPGVISTINKPRGVFTCRSSTLAVFVNFDPFRGLLLNVLWSQSDFHGCRTPRYAYVLVVKTRSLVDSGPFRGLLLIVLASRSDFHQYRTPGRVNVSVINTRGFCRF